MLNSIVIAIIGGTRMQGGKSSIVGMFVAAVFVTIVSNGLFHMAVSPSVQNLTVGAIIIVVLSVNAVIENNRIELKRS
jgi:ribose/xylose/arabinose/galactoside ABC-type transport system permease subunit